MAVEIFEIIYCHCLFDARIIKKIVLSYSIKGKSAWFDIKEFL